MATLQELKQQLFKNVELRLGGGMVDIELDPEHYEAAYQYALATYRQRGANAYEESYSLLPLEKDKSVYVLPQEITRVRQVFRRTIGLETGPRRHIIRPFLICDSKYILAQLQLQWRFSNL